METNVAYQHYIADTKNLRTPQGRLDYQKPYAEAFEKIYATAMDEDVNLATAKNFIDGLSKGELGIIQKYNGLADAIDRGSLSAEGAYNLLVHDNEQYDFNGDGRIQVGAADIVPTVPTTMPPEVRSAYIEALNTLEGRDRMMAMTLTFDMGRIASRINNTPYEPQTIDYDYLSKQVDAMLNPKGGAFTSEATKQAIITFWEAFESAYKGEKSNVTEEETDPAVAKFLEDLRSKGAVAFLAEFNMEKIEKKVEEFRQKLLKEMGDSDENMAKIEELVSQFRKQLMEELQASLDNEKEKPKFDAEAMIKTLLNMKSDKNSELEKLLHVEQKRA
jgi:predicted RNase H-related nuclease YkuK (DUF458 family)